MHWLESILPSELGNRGCSQSEFQVTCFLSYSEECGEVFGGRIYHCFPNKYRTGKLILAIVFRLQAQIPNFSESIIIITGTAFPDNRIN